MADFQTGYPKTRSQRQLLAVTSSPSRLPGEIRVKINRYGPKVEKPQTDFTGEGPGTKRRHLNFPGLHPSRRVYCYLLLLNYHFPKP